MENNIQFNELISITNKNNINFPNKYLQKLIFLENALNDGWYIHKKKDIYIFKKKHNKEKKIYDENYIYNFVNKYKYII